MKMVWPVMQAASSEQRKAVAAAISSASPARRIGKLVRTMRLADLDELETGRADPEAVIRAWCDWNADVPNPPAPA
jgi:hypothetical protein